MSADIGRHTFVPGTGRDKCAECYCPQAHSIHAGQRPAQVCRRTGAHGSHGKCAGVDFPTDFTLTSGADSQAMFEARASSRHLTDTWTPADVREGRWNR